MATPSSSGAPPPAPSSTGPESTTARQGDSSLIGHALTAVSGRDVTAFGRTVTATAATLIQPLGDSISISATANHYQNAMTDISKELRRPSIQHRLSTLAQRTPTEIVRGKLSTTEIQHKALTYLPDELLHNIPDHENQYSLFQGFKATLPDPKHVRKSRKAKKDGQKQITDSDIGSDTTTIAKLQGDRESLAHQLEMYSIRKNMASCEIREIDIKISNLNSMRNIVLERLAKLEQEEAQLEHEILEVDNKIEDLQEELDSVHLEGDGDSDTPSSDNNNGSFMTESVYGKLSSSGLKAPKKHRSKRRISMPILHEHFEPGTKISEIQCHADSVTALDFDVPFGTMVTSALDDTVRVWDLSSGRCLGQLEGHRASVRCLQVEDNLVATGSADASIRLWDLSRVDTSPRPNGNRITRKKAYDADDEETDDGNAIPSHASTGISSPRESTNLSDCAVFSLDAHVDEVTAIYFQGDTLVSGSADKTLRQWDLEKGRCVQTLDVLWAAAQSSIATDDSKWKTTGRTADRKADFVGALQCFDAALACGTADGMVRLWDLRSGQVHRSLVGHTGPVTCLQFDEVHLVTGSLDRSIRIWDLRTGTIYDAYAYDNPITDMQFDARRIVSAAQEPMAKVYDKADGKHWDCGDKEPLEDGKARAIVDRVRIKEGYLVEGRTDGVVGVWAC